MDYRGIMLKRMMLESGEARLCGRRGQNWRVQKRVTATSARKGINKFDSAIIFWHAAMVKPFLPVLCTLAVTRCSLRMFRLSLPHRLRPYPLVYAFGFLVGLPGNFSARQTKSIS